MKEITTYIFEKWAEPITEAIIIIIALYILLWPVKIHGSAMANTINDGDWIFGSRIIARMSDTKSGDLVMFKVNGELGLTVKRVIALSGDRVVIRNGLVYINNELLEEDYLTGATEGEFDALIEEGSFFALGDNSAASIDSRHYGQVPLKNIKSRVIFKFYPFKDITAFINFE